MARGKTFTKARLKNTTEIPLELAGHQFSMRTTDGERLQKAAAWLNHRIKKHQQDHPMLKPSETFLLLLLELAYDREEFKASSKALLQTTDQLLKWIETQ